MVQPDYNVSFEYGGKNYSLDFAQNEDKTINILFSSEASPFLTSFESLSGKTLEDLKGFLKELGATSIEVPSRIDRIRAATIDSRSPEEKLEAAYNKMVRGLNEYYESGKVGKGALMVRVVGVDGATPITYGQLSVDKPVAPTENTIGRTGSGAKLWASLLSKTIAKKYPSYFRMSDGLGKFAPKEALQKFSGLELGDVSYSGEELAKEISLEALLSMTVGLEYEDKGPKRDDTRGQDLSLDQLMRNPEIIPDHSIRFVGHPRDRIYWYTNNIGLIAYPVEKAYKKVLANELFEDKSIKVRDIPGGSSYDTVIQDLSLEQLLESEEAYVQGAYVYDLIDLFLASRGDHDPPYNEFTFSHIMRRELLEPLGMDRSGYYDTPELQGVEQTDMTNNEKAISMPPPRENVMLRGAGAGRTTLEDASRLARGLAGSEGLKDKRGRLLLSKDDLDSLFTPYGHFPGWALGADVEFKGEFVEKGGNYDEDAYSFWVDRKLGVGVIAMSNYGDIPKVLEEFKADVQAISHPNQQTVREQRSSHLLDISSSEYVAHPMQNSVEYFEGTRGKIGLEFAWNKDEEGVMNWSGTPLKLKKQGDNNYMITTPGRFEGVKVWKEQGKNTGRDYIAIGDTAFIKSDIKKIPAAEELQLAQTIFPQLAGSYRNMKHLDWADFHFSVEDVNGTLLLKAKTFAPENPPTPLYLVSAKPDEIIVTGHDREPPDKMFRFYLEDSQWKMNVTDVVSSDLRLDTRVKV